MYVWYVHTYVEMYLLEFCDVFRQFDIKASYILGSIIAGFARLRHCSYRYRCVCVQPSGIVDIIGTAR